MGSQQPLADACFLLLAEAQGNKQTVEHLGLVTPRHKVLTGSTGLSAAASAKRFSSGFGASERSYTLL